MLLGRLLPLVVLLPLLAAPSSCQLYQPPDYWFEFIYTPLIVWIVRLHEFKKNIKGGWKSWKKWKSFLGRRRRSLDSPSGGDLCDLQQPCLALQAMDAGQLDQWVGHRWPAAADSWRSHPQLAQLLARLEQLQREERPHSRQLRRRACQAVIKRCPEDGGANVEGLH